MISIAFLDIAMEYPQNNWVNWNPFIWGIVVNSDYTGFINPDFIPEYINSKKIIYVVSVEVDGLQYLQVYNKNDLENNEKAFLYDRDSTQLQIHFENNNNPWNYQNIKLGGKFSVMKSPLSPFEFDGIIDGVYYENRLLNVPLNEKQIEDPFFNEMKFLNTVVKINNNDHKYNLLTEKEDVFGNKAVLNLLTVEKIEDIQTTSPQVLWFGYVGKITTGNTLDIEINDARQKLDYSTPDRSLNKVQWPDIDKEVNVYETWGSLRNVSLVPLDSKKLGPEDQITIRFSSNIVEDNTVTTTLTLNGIVQPDIITVWDTDHDTTIANHKNAISLVSGVTATLPELEETNKKIQVNYIGRLKINTVVTEGETQTKVFYTYINLGITEFKFMISDAINWDIGGITRVYVDDIEIIHDNIIKIFDNIHYIEIDENEFNDNGKYVNLNKVTSDISGYKDPETNTVVHNPLDIIRLQLKRIYNHDFTNLFFDVTNWRDNYKAAFNVCMLLTKPTPLYAQIEQLQKSTLGLFDISANGKYTFDIRNLQTIPIATFKKEWYLPLNYTPVITRDPKRILSEVTTKYIPDWNNSNNTYEQYTYNQEKDIVFDKYGSRASKTYSTLISSVRDAKNHAFRLWKYYGTLHKTIPITVKSNFIKGLKSGDIIELPIDYPNEEYLGMNRAIILSLNSDIDKNETQLTLRLLEDTAMQVGHFNDYHIGVLNFAYNSYLPEGITIHTNYSSIHQSQMPTVFIEGYNYGINTINFQLCYYLYGISNPVFTQKSCKNNGGYACNIKLGIINEKVCIWLDMKNEYFIRFNIRGYDTKRIEALDKSWEGWYATISDFTEAINVVDVPFT